MNLFGKKGFGAGMPPDNEGKLDAERLESDIATMRGFLRSYRFILGDANYDYSGLSYGILDFEVQKAKADLRRRYPDDWTEKNFEVIIFAPYFIGIELGLDPKKSYSAWRKSFDSALKGKVTSASVGDALAELNELYRSDSKQNK